MRSVQKILFLRTDRMGDVLMNLGAVRLLRQAYPKAWITLMCDSTVAPLLRGHADLDEVWALSAEKIKKSFWLRLKMAVRLRKVCYDLAIVSNPDKRLHGMVFWAGIPIRVGWKRKRGFFLTHACEDPRSDDWHEVDRNLKLVERVTKEQWDGQLTLRRDPEGRQWIDAQLKEVFGSDKAIVVIHPGTTRTEKRWAPDRFGVLCDRLSKAGYSNLLLLGGPEEKETSKAVIRGAKVPIRDWTGNLSWTQTRDLLSHPRVCLLVSSDSGPAHIAWICGTPVAVLFAKDLPGSTPKRWGPRDPRSKVIWKPMQEITVQEVFEACLGILKNSILDQASLRMESGRGRTAV